MVGTTVRGIRTPIIKEKADLSEIVVDCLQKASEEENFTFADKDIVGLTEAIVAISEGNYATIDEVVIDLKNKYKTNHIGVVFPILSRNRFALILKSIARAFNKITLLLSYPADEVGNAILDEEKLVSNNINPYSDIISFDKYKELFADFVHPFTKINMIDFYKEVAMSENCQLEVVLSNNPQDILNYTKDVLVCDIHTRNQTYDKLKQANTLYMLTDIVNEPINGSGYNPKYGLLGSNRSTEEVLKLFPRGGEELVNDIQNKLYQKTGKKIEVLVYGDGAFKDPVGKIWELADPVVSPAYTQGLVGTPNEIKLKYVSDNDFSHLTGEELNNAVKQAIKEKEENLQGKMITQGTTPRQLTDLIGSLCDLTSGSGDKGTPVVYIQGYFDNYASE